MQHDNNNKNNNNNNNNNNNTRADWTVRQSSRASYTMVADP